MFKIIIKTIKYKFLSEMSYKADFIGDLFITFAINFFTISLFKVIFSYSENFSYWTYDDFFLASLFFIAFRLLIECLDDGMFDFFEHVFSGKIDTYLCKPVKLYYLVVIYFIKPSKLLIALLMYSYVFYYIFKNNLASNYIEAFLVILSTIIFSLIGLLFTFILSSLNLFSEKNLFIGIYNYHLSQMCYLPPTVYGEKLFKTLFISIPFIFSASVPVLILKHAQYYLFYLSFLPLTILLFIAYIFYKNYRPLLKSFGG